MHVGCSLLGGKVGEVRECFFLQRSELLNTVNGLWVCLQFIGVAKGSWLQFDLLQLKTSGTSPFLWGMRSQW